MYRDYLHNYNNNGVKGFTILITHDIIFGTSECT